MKPWRRSRPKRAVLFGLLVSLRPGFAFSENLQARLSQIQLPPGFSISLVTDAVEGARSLTQSPSGTLFVGSRRGSLYAIRNLSAKSPEVVEFAKNLKQPVGVTFHNGALYVSDVGRILRFDEIESQLKNSPKPQVITEKLPKKSHHGWKYLGFGPDGLLYVAIGMPCNICTQEDPRFGTILRMKPDGSSQEIFARGIRNSVGFDWHPVKKELWFTDNGRDLMGDDVPPDELNHAPKAGLDFGFPYCHGGTIADPELNPGESRPCSSFTPPAQALGPHVAALGMRFYAGKQFPAEYQNQIFIAEHGSWNRTTPIGYRITRVRLNGNKATQYEIFAEGWLQDGKPWGRPADVWLDRADGSLLVSDDYAGAIYRIRYSKNESKTAPNSR